MEGNNKVWYLIMTFILNIRTQRQQRSTQFIGWDRIVFPPPLEFIPSYKVYMERLLQGRKQQFLYHLLWRTHRVYILQIMCVCMCISEYNGGTQNEAVMLKSCRKYTCFNSSLCLDQCLIQTWKLSVWISASCLWPSMLLRYFIFGMLLSAV